MARKKTASVTKYGRGADRDGTNGVATSMVAVPVEDGDDQGASPGLVDLVPLVAPFPIVGLGASAGGLEAFTQLLTQLPADSGMAFVLIQHLDPSHKSFLGESLSKVTRMPVSEAHDGDRVAPNHVYVTPSDADVSIHRGLLTLVPRTEDQPRLHLPIDFFFSALATDRGSHAIGVVLSGTASDGTEGLKAIKAAGGIALVQDPRTAKFAGMPQSALDSGIVDAALPIAALASELARLSRHPYLASTSPIAAAMQTAARPGNGAGDTPDRSGPPAPEDTTFKRIIDLIKASVGVDFGEYKPPTFERRLARRMALARIEDRENYLELLQRNPEEVRALYEDTLIHVSSFFRDSDVFETLKLVAFPEIVKQKAGGAAIRIWVAGCSTGQEVYSLAISLLEFLVDAPRPQPIQIFGTDLSEGAIHTARAGRYSDDAMRGISEEQRNRYFAKTDRGFRINKNVRDLCVFVRHDLARDPPFSKLDLISCRNVLIYFDQRLQKRVLPTFHYSLNEPGFLLLGRSENISGFSQLFSPVDKARKIFARSAVPSGLRFVSRSETPPSRAQPPEMGTSRPPLRAADISKHLDNLLLARYAPPGVLVNEKLEVLQFRGQTGDFLQAAPGEPQNNIVKMARGGLLAKLRATLALAKREMAPVRTEGVEVDQNGFTTTCDLVILPFAGLPDIKEPLFVVLFETRPVPGARDRAHSSRDSGRAPPPAGRPKHESAGENRRIPKLEHELSATTEYLHSLIEEHSRTADDLGSANEELVSGNEELQSLNEELETAKEELQSTNEELTTVNDELHSRNLEVGHINTDLANLLDTVDTPVVILDKSRHIRRFTPQARNILNVLPTDVGRLFDDIKPRIDVPDLDQQITEVIATFVAKESEVQDREGHWYRMQIRPYKTAKNDTGGAIVSLFDIHALKHHLDQAQQAKEDAERSDRAKDEFLAVLSHELRTPLSALLMQTQLLSQAGLDSVKRDRACAAIERSTKMQVKLVDDLLDVSRIVTGKLTIDLQPVDLVALVRTALESVVALAETKTIEVTSFLDESVGPVSGDWTRLHQVVCNLLINAIKFTPRGGKIEVLLERVAEQAHLKVSDTGMGIEADFLPRIFNRLTQKDSSSTRPNAGLGLGLAIVRHLVDAHGGTVSAESPGLGKGATLHVNLPLSLALPTAARNGGTPAREAPLPGDGAGTGRLAGRRILVVEDDVGIREALEEMLTGTGAVVRTAESAAAGMTQFHRFRPHVLLCDIAMPGEDGYSFLRRIRQLSPEKGGDIPALALTALAGEGGRRRALAEGFQMHLVKPVDIDTLAEAMDELLGYAQDAAILSRERDSSPRV